jgi:hypothetical protein
MKLLKTISKLVVESQRALDEASEKGVSEKELDRLEKNYKESLKLLNLYGNIGKILPKDGE